MGGKGVSGHERPHEGQTNNWGTPLWIVKALGQFDLDPCGRVGHPTAAEVWDENEHDGLHEQWSGRVWMNPPYGPHVGKWLAKLAEYGDGIALIFARTETKAFWEHIWTKADGLLFLVGRIAFLREDGSSTGSAGAPSVLVAYGAKNVEALKNSGLQGALTTNWGLVDDSKVTIQEL